MNFRKTSTSYLGEPVPSNPAPLEQMSYEPAVPTSTPNFTAKLHSFARTADDKIGDLGTPLKPYLPLIGRLLVVMTFFEDTYRITTGWSSQMSFLTRDRRFHKITAFLFLLGNVVCMLYGSLSVIFKKNLGVGVSMLVGVLVSQAYAYSLCFDGQFFARNISLVGGLILVLSEIYQNDRINVFYAGPISNGKDQKQNMLLVGRSLLIVLFISHLVRLKITPYTGIISALSGGLCLLVVIGYRARFSAFILACLLVVQNLLFNQYWKFNSASPMRDQVRYEYFQFMAVVGGLILLASIGAGKLSFDEKRKIY